MNRGMNYDAVFTESNADIQVIAEKLHDFILDNCDGCTLAEIVGLLECEKLALVAAAD